MSRERFFHLSSAIRKLENNEMVRDELRRIDKIAAVSQLASAVAHEIRNPLAAIQWNLNVLREKHQEDEEMYSMMLTELERINATVGELLSLAKSSSTSYEPTDVVAVAKWVVNLMSIQATQANVSIEFTAANVDLVECDENQLKQVFINLLVNALDAMKDGGTIQVTIRPEDAEHICLSFQDSGHGMTEEVRARIGEPFFTTKSEGTGLGLMICRNIIHEHGGQMRINSQPHQGTGIDVILPYRQPSKRNVT